MLTHGRLLVIFQNSLRRVAISVRAEVVISDNSAVLIGWCRSHLLLAGVISTRLRCVFAAKDFQTLFFARPIERSLGINPPCELHRLLPVFLQESTLPLIPPRLR